MSAGDSQRKAADRIGKSESTLRNWLAGWKPGDPEVSSPAGADVGEDGSAVITSDPARGYVPSPTDILTSHGLDIADWEVISIRASRWGNPDEPMIQLRVNAIRKDNLLLVPEVPTAAPTGLVIEEFSHGSVAFIGDQHIPYMNPGWERAVLSYLRIEQPSLIVLLGDAADFSSISRHRTHPRFAATVNETNTAVVQHFARLRQVCPDAQIVLLPGNHDDRILYALQDYKPELYGVRPGQLGDTEEVPLLNYRTLWQLDALGIELVDEDWKLASYNVVPELTARHGYLTGNNSERKLLETHGRSQVHGHDHRGSVIYRTKHDPLDIRVVMSCGTGAEVSPDGLGYQPDPDWTPGIGIGHVWDDGMFVLNFAPYINNKLLLPGGMRFDSEEEEN